MEPYYPVNNEQNNQLFERYKELATKEENAGKAENQHRYQKQNC